MARTKQSARRGRGGGARGRKPLPTKRGRRERELGAADGDPGEGDSGVTGKIFPIPRRQPYLEPKDRHNEALEEYYATQQIVALKDLPALLDALRTPLPTSFRVSANSRFRDDVNRKLETEFSALFSGVTSPDSNDPVVPPTRIPWYPDGLAWTVSTPRFLVRRDNVLAPFHRFLVHMNDLGAINRQEAVSMVPPLLLDMKPDQSVIDLCAAPGSKSAQLLEALANSPNPTHSLSAGGLVIANDTDISRCWMLAHQLRRFGAPNLMVTHHDAQSFPAVTSFDRVLCDVPCTGDGTLRKAPDLWRRWTPQLGNGIHRLQKNILRRGIELLKPGGRIVYSTCSMNPVENEAVVADALRHFGPDVLELIDVSDELPLLKRRPGLRSWKVKDTATSAAEESVVDKTAGANAKEGADTNDQAETRIDDLERSAHQSERNGLKEDQKNGDDVAITEESIGKMPIFGAITGNGWFTKFDDVPERRRKRVVGSLFPPSAEEMETGFFPLQRCLRLLPLDQDTGSFFVAVLVKKEAAASDPIPKPENKCPVAVEIPFKGGEGIVGANLDAKALNSTTDGGENNDAKHGDKEEVVPDPNKKTEKKVRESRTHSRLITDDPLIGLEHRHEAVLLKICDFFGLDEKSCRVCLMTRGSEDAQFKRVLVVSPAVREMLKVSIGSPEGESEGCRRRLRVVNAGVRVFERTRRRDAAVPFRILSDGIEVLRHNMSRRIVHVNKDDLYKMLTMDAVEMLKFDDRETRNAFNGMEPGSALMVQGTGVDAELVLLWKGSHSVTKLMPSDELKAMRERHGLTSPETKVQADRAITSGLSVLESPGNMHSGSGSEVEDTVEPVPKVRKVETEDDLAVGLKVDKEYVGDSVATSEDVSNDVKKG
jgi:multisite-specific tRNA:(cytosine-C5)-methyltransferase